MRRDHQKKNSYERRVYESVDDNSQSYAISQRPMKKRTHVTKGLESVDFIFFFDDGLKRSLNKTLLLNKRFI